MRIALTIAGSDSGGGAGIQADLKAFQRFGVFGTSVLTAVTAQNTVGVSAWQALDVGLITAQLDAVATDLRPHAVKTGMLADETVVAAVVAGLQKYALGPLVVDPVMVAASGDVLLKPQAVGAVRDLMVPRASLVTPNLHEAALLTGEAVEDVPAMQRAARVLVEKLGARAALVKGGHLSHGDAVDVLFVDGRMEVVTHPRLQTRHTHGAGCTLSAAITAQLASGVGVSQAVRVALDYLHRAMVTAPGLGQGHGPLNHQA